MLKVKHEVLPVSYEMIVVSHEISQDCFVAKDHQRQAVLWGWVASKAKRPTTQTHTQIKKL